MGDLNTLSRSSVTLTGCYHCTRGRSDVLPVSDINVDRAWRFVGPGLWWFVGRARPLVVCRARPLVVYRARPLVVCRVRPLVVCRGSGRTSEFAVIKTYNKITCIAPKPFVNKIRGAPRQKGWSIRESENSQVVVRLIEVPWSYGNWQVK